MRTTPRRRDKSQVFTSLVRGKLLNRAKPRANFSLLVLARVSAHVVAPVLGGIVYSLFRSTASRLTFCRLPPFFLGPFGFVVGPLMARRAIRKAASLYHRRCPPPPGGTLLTLMEHSSFCITERAFNDSPKLLAHLLQ